MLDGAIVNRYNLPNPNDPAFADAPKQVMIDELMLAWSEFDYTYALIRR